MAVPVQTWGALGSMIAEQREYGQQSAEYLESNEMYDLFSYLLRQVVIRRPAHPLKFLQEELRSKPALAICVVGPAGINRSRYCQLLSEDHKLKHIHVGKLLRGRRELRDAIEAGNLVDDNVVIEIVKDEITRAKNTGFVLDGFPRTKVQAQALSLKEVGFCIDKILLLNTSDRVIKDRFTEKATAAGMDAGEIENFINTRLQQYHRHVIGIVELFKNVVRQVKIGNIDDERGNYALITSNLHVRPYSLVPYKPHRICIVGACGSGRTTQCKALSKIYGVVHVDLPPLVRELLKSKGMPDEDMPPEYVGDEDLCRIVGKRLSETDCLRKGFVLDGFPKTERQAEFLRQSHMWPTRLVQLKISQEEAVTRIAMRKVDPQTCAAYYRTPQNAEVAERLVQAEYDYPQSVEQRVDKADAELEKVMQVFPMVSTSTRGIGDIMTITSTLQTFLDTPLPWEAAQDQQPNED
mmetsp:Transcript_44425/g.81090  ORF Transcript_44425/g.81090 Transcript_44425/m.81090 type:complete len:466 (+) Transcript_44425:102-1499(+)